MALELFPVPWNGWNFIHPIPWFFRQDFPKFRLKFPFFRQDFPSFQVEFSQVWDWIFPLFWVGISLFLVGFSHIFLAGFSLSGQIFPLIFKLDFPFFGLEFPEFSHWIFPSFLSWIFPLFPLFGVWVFPLFQVGYSLFSRSDFPNLQAGFSLFGVGIFLISPLGFSLFFGLDFPKFR